MFVILPKTKKSYLFTNILICSLIIFLNKSCIYLVSNALQWRKALLTFKIIICISSFTQKIFKFIIYLFFQKLTCKSV